MSHWEPELLDGSGYLSGSVELDSLRLLVHIVATTRGPGPRIVHGGFEGGLSRAMIDLPLGAGAARPSFVSDAPLTGNPLAPPPREAQIESAAGDAPGRPVARRLTLTWNGPRPEASDAELLATSEDAQRAVRALMRWVRGGRHSDPEITVAVAAPVTAQEQSDLERFCTDLDAALTVAVDVQACVTFLDNSGWTVQAPASPTASELPASADDGSWVVGDIEQDAMTDQSTALAYLEAESGTSSFGQPIALVVRCASGQTELFINWNDYLGSDSKVLMDVRVGDALAKREQWGVSTDNTATFYPRDAETFIPSLFGEDQIAYRTTPYDEGPITAVFNLEGTESAMRNVRQACGW